MERFAENDRPRTRVLGLGNELLADDAFGILVAREIERSFPGETDVVCSSAGGFNLLEDLLGAPRLVVVDTIVTGHARPGTIRVFRADQIPSTPGVGPHFLGLSEVLAVGRQLRLDLPEEISVIAVEASDCATIGGVMHPDVRSAVNTVVNLVGQFLAGVSH
jgi:hydrogenase maturation protease